YRVRKFARRHRVAFATTSLVALALVAGASVAVWQAVVATRAKDAALQAAAKEEKAKQAAEARETETRTVLEFVENVLLAAARPKGQGGGLGREVSLRKAVEAALPYVQDKLGTEPLVEARLRITLGKSFSYLGEEDKSGKQFEIARDIFSGHLGPDHPYTLRA